MKFFWGGSVPSDLKDIAVFNDFIFDKILRRYIENEIIYNDLKLALHELIVNGATHGNSQKSYKNVEVFLQFEDKYFVFYVQDQGTGIKIIYDEPTPEFKPCGRGLKIVKKTVDQMEMCHNRVTCVKYLE